MDYDEILRKILRKYGVATDNIRTMQVIESKLKKHTATYADANKFAQDIGRILTDVLREYLPEALTDGKLYRAAAEVLVQQPMITAGKDVADVSKRIQQAMNEDAGIGMNAIDPGMNQDQIDGIITGICNAESYDGYVERFMDQVAGFFEGEVDDFVRENADFQYKAGLSPTIERKISGKCCSWCAKLAGTYPYEDVRDRGNDVFRRHNNCHCQILYNPADGSKKRQNAHTKSWTDEGKADRIAFADSYQSGGVSGAKNTESERKKHAETYYEEIRNRKPYSDAKIIAKRVDGFTEKELEDIRQHMFVREVRRDGTIKRFDPDYDQSQVWQRLTTGQPLWDSDKLMLEHERMESRIMRETGCTYEEAHDETQKVFDWWSAFLDEKERRNK